MTTLRWVGFASIAAVPAAAAVLVASGCSSSNAASSAEAGADTGPVEATVTSDALPEAAGAVRLQWKVVPTLAPAGGLQDAGSEAGSGDGSAAEASTDGASDADTDATGAVQSADGGDGGTPGLAGVEVCVYQNSAIGCVMTDTNGEFDLPGLPVRTNLALTLRKTGYFSVLRAIATASTDMDDRGGTPIGMIPTDSPPPPIGVPVDLQNKGQIKIFTLGQLPDGGTGGFVGDPGARIALTPTSGNGPFYTDKNNQFDLSATSTAGIPTWYFNVDPGTYTLTFTDTNNDCEPLLFPFGIGGYPVPNTKHVVQFPVAAGYITGYVGVICTPNSVIVKVDGG